MTYKFCKFRKSHARDTPLQGVYIPKFGGLGKIFSFGGSIPLSLHRWERNFARSGPMVHSSMPNFSPIGAVSPLQSDKPQNHS